MRPRELNESSRTRSRHGRAAEAASPRSQRLGDAACGEVHLRDAQILVEDVGDATLVVENDRLARLVEPRDGIDDSLRGDVDDGEAIVREVTAVDALTIRAERRAVRITADRN